MGLFTALERGSDATWLIVLLRLSSWWAKRLLIFIETLYGLPLFLLKAKGGLTASSSAFSASSWYLNSTLILGNLSIVCFTSCSKFTSSRLFGDWYTGAGCLRSFAPFASLGSVRVRGAGPPSASCSCASNRKAEALDMLMLTVDFGARGIIFEAYSGGPILFCRLIGSGPSRNSFGWGSGARPQMKRPLAFSF